MPKDPPQADALFEVGATGDTLERMIELFALYGDIYRFYVPARKAYTYVIHHPDDMKRALISNHHNYTKGFERDRIKILLGMGLMTSEGELWIRQRHRGDDCALRDVDAHAEGHVALSPETCAEHACRAPGSNQS